MNVFPTINLNNNNQLLLSLSNNKITRNYTSNIFLVFFASILALSLFMFYMPTSYSQTIESNDFLQEQSEQQQACAEGEVFNTDTQMCEPAATVEEEQQQEPVEEQACAEGEVFNTDT